MRLTSPAFNAGSRIPARHTCEGPNLSPRLVWADPPAEAKSFALLCDDPDAPGGTWRHWGIFDISPEVRELAEGYPAQATVGKTRQAINDFRRLGYGGPCPPPGHGVHHYHFRLFALDVATLPLGAKARCADVETALESHVLASCELVGTYSRK
jgi:Raf kinase inhibitor-like YbhB/YbcL family protein